MFYYVYRVKFDTSTHNILILSDLASNSDKYIDLNQFLYVFDYKLVSFEEYVGVMHVILVKKPDYLEKNEEDEEVGFPVSHSIDDPSYTEEKIMNETWKSLLGPWNIRK